MSEVPGRVRRAFAGHSGFEEAGVDEYVSTATPFDAQVRVETADDGHVRFAVEVRVPTLSAVVDGDVADVVEAGWTETFELRVEDVGGVTKVDRGLSPTVRQLDEELVVRVEYTDLNERRGVDDAAALVTFVEGTYVQGVIPGYDYTEPVTSLMSSAKDAGGF
ncbi:DUF5813 family protein [Salinigranum halophilum]|jgi:hypothetical protein|uniref:DUF5813 family protein n=1 Tax=Salinigranum halophilum TaxID=2565931 RepID=UPI0010A76AE5|nr:DUF5813 family protein [Salinigranum halophilum]